MTFECERCKYTTKLKADFKKHLNLKISCEPKFSSKSINDILKELVNNESKEYICDKCNKGFKSPSSRANHKRICTKDDNYLYKEQIAIMNNKIKELEEKVQELTLNKYKETNEC